MPPKQPVGCTCFSPGPARRPVWTGRLSLGPSLALSSGLLLLVATWERVATRGCGLLGSHTGPAPRAGEGPAIPPGPGPRSIRPGEGCWRPGHLGHPPPPVAGALLLTEEASSSHTRGSSEFRFFWCLRGITGITAPGCEVIKLPGQVVNTRPPVTGEAAHVHLHYCQETLGSGRSACPPEGEARES